MLDSPQELCAQALFAGFVPNSFATNRFKVGGIVIYTKATDLIFYGVLIVATELYPIAEQTL